MTSKVSFVLSGLLLSSIVPSNQFNPAHHIRWGVCSTQESFLTLSYVSLWMCELECLWRRKCQAINYWTLLHSCQLMAMSEENVPAEYQPYCVYARREDMEPELKTLYMHMYSQMHSKVPDRCLNCDAGEMCDAHDATCLTKECQDFTILNGVVLGNVHIQGAKVAFLCNHGYDLDPPGAMSVCQPSGNWSFVPKCVTDCGHPPHVANAAFVSAGETTEGATRTYECAVGHVVKKDGVKTTHKTENVSCDANGSWMVDFECAENCPDGWKLLGTSCYNFTNIVRTMTYAQQACAEADPDAHLVIMNKQNETQLLREWYSGQVMSSRYAYVGGLQTGPNEWTWSDGTLIGTWGWGKGQPDYTHDQNCLFIRMANFLWHDFHCHWTMQALCELELI